ncbi:disulfide bond formation protein B [Martelella mediterranea]|uniref:Disulfide bond formation protein DsbB n=1 Tax=Martelella mediterranea TaxID=293089 RepID=A0A4V2V302_9HYPH|nr:disulfide bond formation protein B [Martelella mediterranea]TCT27729.1 disulfide bond formation protein DsbB [Martelella mediterranea]
MIPNIISRNRLVIALSLTTLGMAVSVGSALGFEHIGGYIPCHLCLLERNPYYIGVPVGIAGLLAYRFNILPGLLGRLALLIIAGLMIWGMGMGIYHSGVEWHWWAGPTDCSGALDSVTKDVSTLLSDLNTVKGPKCDEAALRVLGLSFAGWNVVVSIIIAAIAIWGVGKARR